MQEGFTPEAWARWTAIPLELRKRLIGNVWCSHCTGETTIVDYSGVVETGNLVLEGSCATCGGPVARVIEGR